MRILVCGAGVAGLATAINLGRDGHDVTLLELAPEVRTSGGPVDVRGDALDFIRQMGIFGDIKAAEVHMTANVECVDASGHRIATLPPEVSNDSPDDIEISRTSLLSILVDALPADVDLRLSTTIGSIDDRGDHVQVVLTDGTEGSYDLLVGADGLHSMTRRTVFGPESAFVHFRGYYAGFAPVGPAAPAGTTSKTFNLPGKMIGLVQADEIEMAVVMFRSPEIDYDHRDTEAIKQILLQAFEEDVWRTQELIGRFVESEGLYFDAIAQTRMDSWHQGRVVLVGDAAHCASPLSGRGVSLGISGGLFLAQALAEHADDLEAAYARYAELQRPYVEHAQGGIDAAADMIFPATAEAIDARNAAIREMAGA